MSSSMTWTEDQLAAINFPADSSACVTAAAGSGKTALLIERVVKLIEGAEPQVQGDKLAILTFTRNAAEEFRTRMTLAIDKASRSGSVQREQLIKFRSSVITTINAFCLGVLKEHAELFDLPVSFTVLEDSKGEIMRNSALDSAMEYFYSKDFENGFPEKFKQFGGKFSDADKAAIGANAREQLYKSFSYSKDDMLRKAVMELFLSSTSLSDSNEWLENSAKAYSSVERLEERFLPEIISSLRQKFKLLRSSLEQEKTLCYAADSTFIDYFTTIYEADNSMISEMENAFNRAFPEGQAPKLSSLSDFRQRFNGVKFTSFSTKGKPSEKPGYSAYKEIVDVVRKRIKTYHADILENSSYTVEIIEKELPRQHLAVSALVTLVQELDKNYSAMKRRAGVVDFADCERMLLNKLQEKDSRLRQELSDRYQCIIVDEFQDTNDLQYEIFSRISREGKNMFFVGDVKQSIYAFRGGNPRIMAGCCKEGSGFEKLPLNRNFRSRQEVINTVNAMFDNVMTERYGEVDYSDGNRLELGAKFPPLPDGDQSYFSELYLLDFPEREKPEGAENTQDTADKSTGNSQPLKLEANNFTAEARFTASLINKMVNERFMLKKDAETLRPCSWGDFAILLRSKTHFAEYKSELEKLGIPVASNGGSYLSADEINLILNYLKVIDNPQLDEELLSVLMSPLYCFSAEELSLARLGILGYDLEQLDSSEIDLTPVYDKYAGWSLFSCVSAAAQEEMQGLEETGNDEENEDTDASFSVVDLLRSKGIRRVSDAKCRRFIQHFEEFRRFAANNSVERLIRRIYDDTDFFSVISTYERGDKKLANIRLLLKYTADFESGGGGTLNDFLRYTDAVRENAGRLEEAAVPQEAEDAVQLLSFHASKGLQWKIVILGGLGSQQYADRGSLIIDRNAGIGLKYTNIEARVRSATLGYNGARASADTSQLGDELRLLYVAMTRAEEKLIMIGQISRKAAGECFSDSYSPEYILSGSNFMKWIVSSMSRYRPDLSVRSIPQLMETPSLKLSWFCERLPGPEELLSGDDTADGKIVNDELPEPDKTAAEAISAAVGQEYPNQYETTLQSRFSVTEIARRSVADIKQQRDIPLTKPSFLEPKKPGDISVTGVLVGNTYHHIMELIPLEPLKKVNSDYNEEDMYAAVETEIDLLIEQQRLTPEECLLAGGSSHDRFVKKTAGFFCSRLGREMLSAERVEREYELFAELSVRDALDDLTAPADKTTIIQGRVDMLYIRKDGGLVIVDYKSDTRKSLDMELESYGNQLRLYRKILPLFLPKCDGGKIKMLIYSFGQGKIIDIGKKITDKF